MYASKRLRDNKKIVLAAVENDSEAFYLTPDNLRNDEEIIKQFEKSKKIKK